MPEPRFEVKIDSRGEFRFNLIAPNNEIIARSEGYRTYQGCEKGIMSVKENAPKAKIVDRF